MDIVLIAIVAAIVVYMIWPSRDVDEVRQDPPDVSIEDPFVNLELNQENLDNLGEAIKDKIEENLPEFGKMTKVQIEEWARANLGLELDRRKTKANMIADIKDFFKG